MTLHTYYRDNNDNVVYLDSYDNTNAFYRVGKELIVSTVEFFASKYKLTTK